MAEDVAWRQNKSHQKFMLAALVLHQQIGRLDSLLSVCRMLYGHTRRYHACTKAARWWSQSKTFKVLDLSISHNIISMSASYCTLLLFHTCYLLDWHTSDLVIPIVLQRSQRRDWREEWQRMDIWFHEPDHRKQRTSLIRMRYFSRCHLHYWNHTPGNSDNNWVSKHGHASLVFPCLLYTSNTNEN